MAQLPKGFEPYNTLDFCGNTLERVTVPFVVGDHLPLLIGRGPSGPIVWLSVPDERDLEKWIPVVTANETSMPGLDLRTGGSGELVMHLNSTLILLMTSSKDQAVVVEIDLTPLGLGVRGDKHGLWVAGSTLSGNKFSNLRAMLSLGP